MIKESTTSFFEAQLLRRKIADEKNKRSFLILPEAANESLPRRGRTTVEGTVNG